MTDLKAELHEKLKVTRAVMLDKLEGLSEYDVRRPITASGTNLLGLVKHLTGCEHAYLGDTFGRTPPDVLPWNEHSWVASAVRGPALTLEGTPASMRRIVAVR